jgi:16S rRNA (uracil1498-N3)-methyltransferase
VERVVLFVSARARRSPGADEAARRLARLRRVAAAAARQAGHGRETRVEGLVPFPAVLDELDADEAYLIDARGEAGLTTALGAGPERRALLVGPEAGFSPGEVDGARERGLRVCRLGPVTLRAETAAITALVLALAAGGRFAEGA